VDYIQIALRSYRDKESGLQYKSVMTPGHMVWVSTTMSSRALDRADFLKKC
jgi:hypothetical protein